MSSRRVRWALGALLLCSAAARADSRVEARRHFKTGMALIAEGRTDEGVAELLEAYAVRPHPNVLFNVARAYESAGRLSEAATYYRRYLEADPPDAPAVRQTLDALEARLPRRAPEPQPEAARPEPKGPSQAVQPRADEASLRQLAELTDRLERAVARAERAPELAPAAAPGPSPAALAPGPSDFGVPYEETVVAASRRAQSTLEAPTSITIITGDEIRASGLTTLPELLRRVPGAEVMQLGYASTNVSFRGFNQRIANKVLVLIDGRPEYQDFLALTLWPAIPIGLEEIDRVEVIRGPGSALYGANAMLGVVNILTRAPGSGPRAEASLLAGNGNLVEGSFVASGGDRLAYRASVGYHQADKFSRDYDSPRPDVQATVADPNLALREARGNLTAHYAFTRDISVAVSGGVNRLYAELYAPGLLRNYALDGVAGYAKADFTGGPVKLRFFWNTSSFDAGPQYEAIGQRSLATHLDSNVFDLEAFFQKEVQLAGTHALAAGVSGRLKEVTWSYLGTPQQELHAAAFIQDEWRILRPLTLAASYRVDRHPLLDNGNPGFAQSPRISVVLSPLEGHAWRASFATAFREPSFFESYLSLRTPVPGVGGASVLTEGNRALRAERLLSFEVGYRGEAARLGLSWDVALYWNTVSDLVVLSAVAPVSAASAFDPESGTWLLGRSTFTNDPQTYTALGGELGLTWNALTGLDVRASAALQQVMANAPTAVCGPCSQAPALKLNGGVIYRTPVHIDLSADVSFVSATTWVEREPAAADPTQIVNLQNPLAASVVLNARVAWRFWDDRLTVAVVGSQLGPDHQEHPFGNNLSRRVFAQLTVQP
jgi:iron complex outermembrane recepter protein